MMKKETDNEYDDTVHSHREDGGGNIIHTQRNDYTKSLIAIGIVQSIDSISSMVVIPSILFYIIEVGHGTIHQYGLAVSAFSLSCVVSKPLLGIWLDSRPYSNGSGSSGISGGKYHMPYIASLSIGGIGGGLIYFMASLFATTAETTGSIGEGLLAENDNGDDDGNDTTISSFYGNMSLTVILIVIGRILNGFGAANETLRDAYLSDTVPNKDFTSTLLMINMTRIFGMVTGPGFQFLLDKINFTITFSGDSGSEGGYSIDVTPLNSVGLFVAIINCIALLAVYWLLEEPKGTREEYPEQQAADAIAAMRGKSMTLSETDTTMTSDNDEEDVQDILFSYNEDEKNGSLWSSLFQIEIILPLCTVLFTNSEFQLYVARFGDWFNICSISNWLLLLHLRPFVLVIFVVSLPLL